LHKQHGEKLKDIGTYFGIGESGVSQACRRVKDKRRNDKKLERKIAKIEDLIISQNLLAIHKYYDIMCIKLLEEVEK